MSPKKAGQRMMKASEALERARMEKILQARLRIAEYAAEHSLSELLQNALDELCALTESLVGFFHFVEADQRTLWLQTWSTRTLKEFCSAEGKGQHYDIDQAGVWVDCVREGRPVIHNDYASLPHRKGLPDGHAPVIREMVFPIMRKQKIVAIIGVGNKETDYTEDDVTYASRLADLIWDVTERKRVEEELRRSEARYRSILEDQTELICRYLPDGRLSYVNEAYARYYGETAEKLINTNFLPRIPEDELAMIVGKIAAIMPQNPVVAYEHRIIKPDGEIRWQQWTHRGVYDGKNKLIEHQAVGRDITERIHAEQTVSENEQRFRFILENVQDAVWSANTAGQFNFISPVMERIYGQPLKGMMANPAFWIEASHPDDRDLARASAEWLFRDKKVAIEYRIIRPDGATRWISDRKFVMEDERGEPARLIGVVSDITERIQTQEQIQFLARLPAENPNPILRVAHDGILLYVNEAGSALLPRWNLQVGQPIPDILENAVFQSMRDETSRTIDVEQERRLYAFHVTPIISAGYANLYGRDITESQQVKDLRDAEARYRTLFEQSPYGIVLVDMETGKTIEANGMAAKQLGYAREEFAKLKISDYEAHDTPEQIAMRMQKIINEGSDEFETLHRAKSGELKNVHVQVQTVQMNGRVLFYAIYEDVTERKRMEEANESYSREIALLEERQRIASDLHDSVSQTLFSARLTAETLTRQTDRQSDSFTRSLTDLHRLARSAAGELRLILVELRHNALNSVNLNVLLTNLIEAGMARTNASLIFECETDELTLSAPIKLAFYRIAQEAINNAIKHGKPNNIHCILRGNEREAEMIVRDDGIGFVPEKVSDDHFGLQIMHERAEQARAALNVVTQPGKGVSVTVTWKKEEP